MNNKLGLSICIWMRVYILFTWYFVGNWLLLLLLLWQSNMNNGQSNKRIYETICSFTHVHLYYVNMDLNSPIDTMHAELNQTALAHQRNNYTTQQMKQFFSHRKFKNKRIQFAIEWKKIGRKRLMWIKLLFVAISISDSSISPKM